MGQRRVRVLTCTSCTAQVYSRTPNGVSRAWLAQDPRIELAVLCDLTADQLPQAWTQAWARGLQALAAGQLDTLVWLREDVCPDDFLLADRLEEAFASTGAGTLAMADAQGRWLIGAVRAQGLSDAAQVAPLGPSLSHWPMLGVALSLQPLEAGALLPPPSQVQWQRAVMPSRPLLVVTATREKPADFFTHTPLGRSIVQLRQAGMTLLVHAACDNRRSLGQVYNGAISPAHAQCNVVFMHDDVQVVDGLWAQHLDEALDTFDVVGLAGNVRHKPGQPAWHFPRQVGQWDAPDQLRGCVGHDTTARTTPGRKVRGVSHYGPNRSAVDVLDGVLLAARMQTLLTTGLRFDERLGFHFYDLDFCRSALTLGLQPGVWGIAVMHMSSGAYRSPAWSEAYRRYLAKWGESAPVAA